MSIYSDDANLSGHLGMNYQTNIVLEVVLVGTGLVAVDLGDLCEIGRPEA
jgi:hypothetical protein